MDTVTTVPSFSSRGSRGFHDPFTYSAQSLKAILIILSTGIPFFRFLETLLPGSLPFFVGGVSLWVFSPLLLLFSSSRTSFAILLIQTQGNRIMVQAGPVVPPQAGTPHQVSNTLGLVRA